MAQDDFLSQDEIDALLNGPGGDDKEKGETDSGQQTMRPFDPVNQHRIIRGRLDGLDIINQRFARDFRVSLFNLLRRSADITVDRIYHKTFKDFARNVPVPTNLNLISMKPLRGTALMVFPPNLIYMVVDNLFGGDGRFMIKSEGREFTNTEQRIIQRVLDLAIEAYQKSWKSIFELQLAYIRSEVQAKFVNITNSPNEIVLITKFNIEVGGMSSYLQICIPYSMVEPIRDRLANPNTNRTQNDAIWGKRLAKKLHHPRVDLIADFVNIPSSISKIKALQVGDILPIELPKTILAKVDDIPVLQCEYGTHNKHTALRVRKVFNHDKPEQIDADEFIQETYTTHKGS